MSNSIESAKTAGGIPATFGAGCFWGTENMFTKRFGNAKKEKESGLLFHEVGYMSGDQCDAQGKKPTFNVNYELVKTGKSGLAEILHVYYNPEKIKYDDLVYFFFSIHNATEPNILTSNSRSTIMVHDEKQRTIAKRIIQELSTGMPVPGETPENVDVPKLRESFVKVFGNGKINTTVETATTFFRAEEYHQHYLEKNPGGYLSHRIHWNY